MIKVSIKGRPYKEIHISGHALYDKYGKDIVCAGVSSIVTTTINGILKLDEKAITYEAKEGLVSIKVINQDKVTMTLVKNMIDLLRELEKTYKKNIKIEEVPL